MHDNIDKQPTEGPNAHEVVEESPNRLRLRLKLKKRKIGIIVGAVILLMAILGLMAILNIENTPVTQNNNDSNCSGEIKTPAMSDNTEGLNNPDKQIIAAKIISSFENSTTTIQYDFAANIEDGRGITAGRAGFTSGTGDLLLVVQSYLCQVPDSPLAKYLNALQEINKAYIAANYEPVGSVQGLDGFIEAWKKEADNPNMITAQDNVYNDLYFKEGLAVAETEGVTSAIGQLIIVDTAVQHGAGQDPDGLYAIVDETKQKFTGDSSLDKFEDEVLWLETFLSVRREHLLHADNPSTRKAWSGSVERIDALLSLINNDELTPPLEWEVYGDRFEISE